VTFSKPNIVYFQLAEKTSKLNFESAHWLHSLVVYFKLEYRKGIQTMSQRQQLERIMEIDRRIRDGEYPNPNQLAQDLEVSRRVIFVDREFMKNRLGAPIEFDRTRGGWYYADETWVLPGIIVTEGELLAFFLSVEVAKRYLGTGLEETLRSAVEKVSKNVKGSVTVDLDTLRSHYSFSTPTLFDSNEQGLVDLHHAIGGSKRVWMRYYTASRDEHTERVVHPYHLSNVRGDWYLIAYDELRQGIRNFAVGRIEEWIVRSETFKRDPKFSVGKYMAAGFQAEHGGEVVDVIVRFAPQAARYVREKRWHDTQEIQEMEGGALILKFQTSGLGEVKRWVLQYGGNAEVLEPAQLREELRAEINSMLARYR
jgi:predicted DNA-binding transcriptional regulator YafY